MAICLGREFCSRIGRLTQILIALPSQSCLCHPYRIENVSLYSLKQTEIRCAGHDVRRPSLPSMRPSSNFLLLVARLRNQPILYLYTPSPAPAFSVHQL
jgi:hypothetical protein